MILKQALKHCSVNCSKCQANKATMATADLQFLLKVQATIGCSLLTAGKLVIAAV